MKRISIFNHKGGVGKTTLTMNVGAALALSGKKVLLVDSDPQCNLTSYLVDSEVVDDLLNNSDAPNGSTLWSALKPVSEAQGGYREVKPIETSTRNLFLVPGDIRLAEFESDLSDFWGQCLQRKMRGFRGTTAISELVATVATRIDADFVLYDSGPNIGPLNRVILLDCDYFVVPVACDLFSLRALRTLGRTLIGWINDWSTIVELAPESAYLLKGRPAFAGYIPENFRIYRDRIISEQSDFLGAIEGEIHSQIVSLLRNLDPSLVAARDSELKLGEVKHYSTLVPASQRLGLPLHQVDAGTGAQRSEAEGTFAHIASRLMGIADGRSSG